MIVSLNTTKLSGDEIIHLSNWIDNYIKYFNILIYFNTYMFSLSAKTQLFSIEIFPNVSHSITISFI